MKSLCCNKPTSVLESRENRQGIRRRRKCKCGKRFTTLEMAMDSLPLEEIQRKILAFQQELNGIFNKAEDIARTQNPTSDLARMPVLDQSGD